MSRIRRCPEHPTRCPKHPNPKPVRVDGRRGDHAAMQRAMALVRGETPPANRAERRALRKGWRRNR